MIYVCAFAFVSAFSIGVTFLVLDFLKGEIKDKYKAGIVMGVICLILSLALDVLAIATLISQTHVCPTCHTLSFGDTYCKNCGQQLMCEENRCPNCNTEYSYDSHYCRNCGIKLS